MEFKNSGKGDATAKKVCYTMAVQKIKEGEIPMQKSRRYQNRVLCVLVFFSVWLCSFLGLGYCTQPYGSDYVPQGQSSFLSLATNPDEIICAGEESESTVYAVILRQHSTRRTGESSLRPVFLFKELTPALLILFFVFLSLHDNSFFSSHTYIIRYIHDKDGQKA